MQLADVKEPRTPASAVFLNEIQRRFVPCRGFPKQELQELASN